MRKVRYQNRIYKETKDGYLKRKSNLSERRSGKPWEISLHREIFQEELGIKIGPDECVHHVDGDRFNNSIDNLMLLSNKAHRAIHLVEKHGQVTECSWRGCYAITSHGAYYQHRFRKRLPCAFDGCSKTTPSLYCGKHKVSIKRKSMKKYCSVEGCTTSVLLEKSMCSYHVRRAGFSLCKVAGCKRKTRNDICGFHQYIEKKYSEVCEKEGCYKRVRHKGYCAEHSYVRVLKPCAYPGCEKGTHNGLCFIHTEKKAKKPKNPECTFEGCSVRTLTGLCSKHRFKEKIKKEKKPPKTCEIPGCDSRAPHGICAYHNTIRCQASGCDAPTTLVVCRRHPEELRQEIISQMPI